MIYKVEQCFKNIRSLLKAFAYLIYIHRRRIAVKQGKTIRNDI